MRRSRMVAVLAVATAALLGSGCLWQVPVSVHRAGQHGGGQRRPTLSGDGRYVAFSSSATDLVPGAGPGVYVRDLRDGATTLASKPLWAGDVGGSSPDISADGSTVVFLQSHELRTTDLATGTTAPLAPPAGDVGEYGSAPSISATGRYVAVAWSSLANATISGLYVIDRQTGTYQRVVPNGGSPSISADGRYVSYQRSGAALGATEVRVVDRTTGIVTDPTADLGGGPANGNAESPAISANGRFVAFASGASDLVAGDTSGYDVFVRDLQTATTTRVSVNVHGATADNESTEPGISADGRFVVFKSFASDLENRPPHTMAYVHDMVTGRTRGVAHGGYGPSISDDGRTMAYLGYDGEHYAEAVPWPWVTSVSPATIVRGTSTSVTVRGDTFLPGTIATVTGDGATVTAITVVSDSELRITVQVAPDAPTGPRTVSVRVPGTGPGAGATNYGLGYDLLTVS